MMNERNVFSFEKLPDEIIDEILQYSGTLLKVALLSKKWQKYVFNTPRYNLRITRKWVNKVNVIDIPATSRGYRNIQVLLPFQYTVAVFEMLQPFAVNLHSLEVYCHSHVAIRCGLPLCFARHFKQNEYIFGDSDLNVMLDISHDSPLNDTPLSLPNLKRLKLYNATCFLQEIQGFLLESLTVEHYDNENLYDMLQMQTELKFLKLNEIYSTNFYEKDLNLLPFNLTGLSICFFGSLNINTPDEYAARNVSAFFIKQKDSLLALDAVLGNFNDTTGCVLLTLLYEMNPRMTLCLKLHNFIYPESFTQISQMTVNLTLYMLNLDDINTRFCYCSRSKDHFYEKYNFPEKFPLIFSSFVHSDEIKLLKCLPRCKELVVKKVLNPKLIFDEVMECCPQMKQVTLKSTIYGKRPITANVVGDKDLLKVLECWECVNSIKFIDEEKSFKKPYNCDWIILLCVLVVCIFIIWIV